MTYAIFSIVCDSAGGKFLDARISPADTVSRYDVVFGGRVYGRLLTCI